MFDIFIILINVSQNERLLENIYYFQFIRELGQIYKRSVFLGIRQYFENMAVFTVLFYCLFASVLTTGNIINIFNRIEILFISGCNFISNHSLSKQLIARAYVLNSFDFLNLSLWIFQFSSNVKTITSKSIIVK